MKIRPFSDLHLEFGMYEIPPLPDDKETVLVLAGDITVATDTKLMQLRFRPFMQKCAEQFKYVVMVMGNHEHYQGNFHHSFRRIVAQINDLPNVFLLEDDSVLLDGIRFIGATLWTDCGNREDLHPASKLHWNGMSDSVVIDCGRLKGFPVEKVREAHLASRAYIMSEVRIAKIMEQKAVLVVHHAPSYQSISKDYTNHPLNKFFASDMVLELVDAGVDLCIHGHMHDAKRYKLASAISEAEVVCNPRGYHGYESKPETRGFNDKLVLEI